MNDMRIREIMGDPISGKPEAALVGFPSDEGVRLNGGRPGAAGAPEKIFEKLMQLTPHSLYLEEHSTLVRKIARPLMLNCTGDVASDQTVLGGKTAGLLSTGTLPVIAGGGHETAFGHFLGYSYSGRPVHILNIDAHTDVRPLKEGRPHSGSPFRQAIEDNAGCCKSYTVMGLQPSAVAPEHLDFVQGKGKAVMGEELNIQVLQDYFGKRSGSTRAEPVMVTMDMDAVDQSQAPGVSAPNPAGISSRLWLDIAFYCGKQKNVTSFDISEVNPLHDRDDQTIRLAALTIWYFLLGLALR